MRIDVLRRSSALHLVKRASLLIFTATATTAAEHGCRLGDGHIPVSVQVDPFGLDHLALRSTGVARTNCGGNDDDYHYEGYEDK